MEMCHIGQHKEPVQKQMQYERCMHSYLGWVYVVLHGLATAEQETASVHVPHQSLHIADLLA